MVTFLTSIPASLILYEPILNETDFILGSGDVGRIQLGALLEIFQVIAQIGMAIAMYSILRRYSEILSLGYVASRIMESAVIAVGAISLLSILTLRDDLAGSADPATLEIAGQTLVAIHDWTFLFGPGFCVGVNGILLGWMMYRTGLMPQGPGATRRRRRSAALRFGDRCVVRRLRAGRRTRSLLDPGGHVRAVLRDLLIAKGFRPSRVLAEE